MTMVQASRPAAMTLQARAELAQATLMRDCCRSAPRLARRRQQVV